MTVLFLMVIVEMIIHRFGNKNFPRRTVDSKSPYFLFFAEECFTFVGTKKAQR